MRVAIIPARGGSKRLPRKNIKIFCGKPIIAYSIGAAIEANIFDKIIVSTDDKEIAEVALEYGAEVPFLRPDNLSDDYSTTLDVISHAIDTLNSQEPVDKVCCLYATAPFLTSADLRNAYDLLETKDTEYVFSATSFPFPIQRALKLSPDNRVEMFNPENFNVRSQDLEEFYHDAGQFYWGLSNAFLEKRVMFSLRSKAYLLPRNRVQDIDTQEDWLEAEFKFKYLYG